MIVTLQNGEEVVIQFRPEVMDLEPFRIAREALGPVVPDIALLEDEELALNSIWAYRMTRIFLPNMVRRHERERSQGRRHDQQVVRQDPLPRLRQGQQ